MIPSVSPLTCISWQQPSEVVGPAATQPNSLIRAFKISKLFNKKKILIIFNMSLGDLSFVFASRTVVLAITGPIFKNTSRKSENICWLAWYRCFECKSRSFKVCYSSLMRLMKIGAIKISFWILETNLFRQYLHWICNASVVDISLNSLG